MIPFAVVMLLYFTPKTVMFVSKKASNGHLAWYWLQPPFILFLIWFFFMITPFILNEMYSIAVIMVITVIVSYILFQDTLTWCSLWCWISNYISIYLIYLVFAKDIL